MIESFEDAMAFAQAIMSDCDTPILDRLKRAHDHGIKMVSKTEYHRGYEDGRRSMDAEHAAVALRLRQLRFDEGSHENLHKVAYAIYPCATGWTCESSRGLRDELVRLLGGVSDEHHPNSSRTSAEPDGEVTVTAELRERVAGVCKVSGLSGEKLYGIADRIDKRVEEFAHDVVMWRNRAEDMRMKRDELQAKLEEAEFAIANWREREKSFDASERMREELRRERDELRERLDRVAAALRGVERGTMSAWEAADEVGRSSPHG